jgi:catechol 2,3-dioxygenase-like lactoylglutathione lyase family enzyme
MTTVARLAAISLDAADARALGDFYRDLLGLEVIWESDDFIALRGAPVILTVQRVPDHRDVEWPHGDVVKQLHLELAVDDLDASEEAAVALGARKASEQPAPDRWRVLLDPAGHPFCITTLVPGS